MSGLADAGRAARVFALGAPPARVAPLGEGLINDTYEVVSADGDRFVLQCINDRLFPAPERVMANIARVTAYLRRHGRPGLELVPTREGAAWHRADDGTAWRCYRFVENARAWARPPDRATARRAAHAFGRFVADLAGLPSDELDEVLPGFHDTPGRLAALERAVAADPLGRAAAVAAELDAIRERTALGGRIAREAMAGELPRRVVHNDTKLNNVLFHRESNEVLCVVDLDTVMPGWLVHDFGDMVRSAATVGEGESTALDLGLFTVLAEGYLEGLGGGLAPAEADCLADAPAVLALELAARFLTDYLEGDRYFRTRVPGENLARCRGSLALLGSMERQRTAMRREVERLTGRRT